MTTLATPRLILRPFESADIPAYADIRAKPHVVQYLSGGAAGAAQAWESAKERVPAFQAIWQEPGGYGPWAVVEKASGQLIGHCGLRVWDALGGATELLYMLDDTAWGKGYATEAARASVRFGFEVLKLDEIVAVALPENSASIRVMERAGMRRLPGFTTVLGKTAVKCVLRREDWLAGEGA